MVDRSQIVADVAGSLHLEGLEPSPEALALLDAWARGDASDADLEAAEQRLLSQRPEPVPAAPAR
jgi:hypothetical protein